MTTDSVMTPTFASIPAKLVPGRRYAIYPEGYPDDCIVLVWNGFAFCDSSADMLEVCDLGMYGPEVVRELS